MNWYYIDEFFLSKLRLVESRVPRTDYGADRWKPFFGILFTMNDISYVTNITSPKPRHTSMKNDIDFVKVYDLSFPFPSPLIAVVNLNYMFPVPNKYLKIVDYTLLKSLLPLKTSIDLSKYWSLLNKELSLINALNLDHKAIDLYEHTKKFPQSIYSQRCLNFISLESIVKTL